MNVLLGVIFIAFCEQDENRAGEQAMRQQLSAVPAECQQGN
jgi:hypothetical protein